MLSGKIFLLRVVSVQCLQCSVKYKQIKVIDTVIGHI